ncbi:ribosomal protein subunit L11 [Schizosaccharomyces japonicus yFS275]|uniref:Ribosomal protein subunit L11 n=1 Tax=Schizosaccharomyces japonicus (strain yFS275 / FY16936) TaxID=402676 RepID=B6K813_SCHJY|nr:ribosomal protein subunit L11 [Schizosaccharomyces japonicus yFS275]EEB09667.1 ribosomal protein subunit L11 [Schizosaccharomyces japonicus yFS275]
MRPTAMLQKTWTTLLKPAASRKSILHHQYTAALQASPNFLVLQHNNLLPSEWSNIRLGLRAIAPQLQLRVVKHLVFRHALRILESYGWKQNGPALTVSPSEASSVEAHNRVKKVTTDIDPLLVGPICVLYLGQHIEPPTLKAVLGLLKPYSRLLLLLGGRLEHGAADVDDITRVSKLSSLSGLQGQLVSLLSQPGLHLTQRLQTAYGRIAHILEQRKA